MRWKRSEACFVFLLAVFLPPDVFLAAGFLAGGALEVEAAL
jgi:hypothetical protein